MIIKSLMIAVIAGAWINGATVSAQEQTDAEVEPQESETTDLLSEEELLELVSPVALYPDTVLTQVLVASTLPIEIVKADRLLAKNEGKSTDEAKALVEAENYDESVEILAVAFPDVLTDLAKNIDWTEAMGLAMLAQTDDVMAAVQTMRQRAVDLGTLETVDEQTVSQNDTGDVIITPTDPQVVYVPEYETETVYVEQESSAGDAVAAIFLFFGTVALIDEIFNDGDDWYHYWGCRNCGGWNGRPIIRNPNVGIEIDSNVNIGNDIEIGDQPDVGWKPSEDQKKEAREQIEGNRTEDGTTQLPTTKEHSAADRVRDDLSGKVGNQNALPEAAKPLPTAKPAISEKRIEPAGGGQSGPTRTKRASGASAPNKPRLPKQ